MPTLPEKKHLNTLYGKHDVFKYKEDLNRKSGTLLTIDYEPKIDWRPTEEIDKILDIKSKQKRKQIEDDFFSNMKTYTTDLMTDLKTTRTFSEDILKFDFSPRPKVILNKGDGYATYMTPYTPNNFKNLKSSGHLGSSYGFSFQAKNQEEANTIAATYGYENPTVNPAWHWQNFRGIRELVEKNDLPATLHELCFIYYQIMRIGLLTLEGIVTGKQIGRAHV